MGNRRQARIALTPCPSQPVVLTRGVYSCASQQNWQARLEAISLILMNEVTRKLTAKTLQQLRVFTELVELLPLRIACTVCNRLQLYGGSWKWDKERRAILFNVVEGKVLQCFLNSLVQRVQNKPLVYIDTNDEHGEGLGQLPGHRLAD